KQQLESTSDILKQLTGQLNQATQALQQTETRLEALKDKRSRIEQKQTDGEALRTQTQALLNETRLVDPERAVYFGILDKARSEVLGGQALTVESCDNREREMRDWLQKQIESESRKLSTLGERIVKAMTSYKEAFRLETSEIDASIEAAFEYRTMLHNLQSDDLPRFEARFKELLNENTIREVANFQSQLARERETIKER
ncbi:MAG: ATP-dependent exonuclease SbcCD, C subunit-like protein, partial [Candidatus Accumulibacter sp.]|nr:ATP-dependent exonuclease SbcCD, C subunit-like protein [Accumulibacter sp.]